MHLTTLLSVDSIRTGLESRDKTTVINQTIDLLAGSEHVLDLDEVRRVVWEREASMSTGVGKGLGLPHAKSDSMRHTVAAISVTRSPIDFGAFDGEPVRIIFLLVGPVEDQALHIRTLSRISRIMHDQNTRNQVIGAGSASEVFDAICRAENALLEVSHG